MTRMMSEGKLVAVLDILFQVHRYSLLKGYDLFQLSLYHSCKWFD